MDKDKIPQEYRVKGTRIVHLARMSQDEGGQFYAQVRRLSGRHLHLFLKHQEVWEKLQAVKEGDDPSDELTVLALERTRAIVHPGVIRVFEVNGDSVITYGVVDSPIGEHEPKDISVDLLELDFTTITTAIIGMATATGGEPEASFHPSPGDADPS